MYKRGMRAAVPLGRSPARGQRKEDRMNELHVDVAVIGTGTAGLGAYRAARDQHRRVVTIESGPDGPTCARVGCMPSKLLIAAAEAAHVAAHADGFGVHAGPVRIDGRPVMARVRSERDRFVGFVLEGVDAIPAADKLRGHARFTGARTLQVDAHTLVHARAVVIATGSRPFVPSELRQAGARVIVSDDVFDWTDLPDSVAVVGSGVIGLELGQALHRLGVRTTVFARGGSIAQLTDPAVRRSAAAALGAELDLRRDCVIVGARQVGAGAAGEEVELTWRTPAGSEQTARYQYVLCAAGRLPNVDLLGLEHAGVATDARGIPLFDPATMQCGASPVFIAGDASAERPVLPEASDQGRIAGENAARYPDVRPGLRRAPLAIAFTEPNIATLGHSFRELSAPGQPRFAVGEVAFSNQGRSRVMRQNVGLLRVYGAYGSGKFLGAELAAPRGEHLAHLLAWACQARLDVHQMLAMPFYHPVVEEGVRTALRDLAAAIERGAPEPDPDPDCVPGV
jgi:dihydrolipoamide dehydrogenase